MRINSVYERWWKRENRSSNPNTQKLDYPSSLVPSPTPNATLGRKPAESLQPHSHDHAVDIEKAVVSPGKSSLEWHTIVKDNVSFCRFVAYPTATVTLEQYQGARRYIRIIRLVRYSIFTVYRRLFTLVFIVNLVAGGVLLQHQESSADGGKSVFEFDNPNTLSTLASANLLAAILVRQDWFINVLFRAAWLVPWNVPLAVRKAVARVYCYGGIHSGAAVAGTLWWVSFTAARSWESSKSEKHRYTLLTLTWTLLILLSVILLFSIPSIREKHHDAFETTHRFLGWSSIAIFWIQLLLLVQEDASTPTSSLGHALLHTPTFWTLSLTTTFLVYPWLRLRRWTFTAHAISPHALHLSFPHAIHKFSCLTISSSPLREWHPFATFPSTDVSTPGASIVISNAGDWTKNLIRSVTAHTQATGKDAVELRFYTKSHPKAGVLSLTCLFPRVLLVTTGSGIGPCLSSLLENGLASSRCPTRSRQFARLVWSSREPEKTFGPHIMALVAKADPDVLVIDTAEMGRPDLLEVAWSMYRKLDVEAVFVLSNQKVVKWVVGGLERRGVPAFGPIWDS